MKKAVIIFYHLLVWTIIIIFCNSSNFLWQGFSVEDGTMLIPSLYGTFFNALLVYFNAFYLYNRKQWPKLKYWAIAILVILVVSLIEGAIDYFYSNQIGVLEHIFESIRSELSKESLNFDLNNALPVLTYVTYVKDDIFVHLLFWFLSFAYILPAESSKNRTIKEKLEKEKLEAEVNFLKAQINPHTLFNGINSIYHLIDKDKEKAKDVLVRFSELLRYQIYECSDKQILLSKEFHFLENYLNIEKIRKGKDVDIMFRFDINEAENFKIAPLLLIPFVENAFKYVSNHDVKEHNFIRCSIFVHKTVMHFSIENSVDINVDSDMSKGGLGLVNVKSRLSLIYPDKYSLDIKNYDNIFSVILKLELNE